MSRRSPRVGGVRRVGITAQAEAYATERQPQEITFLKLVSANEMVYLDWATDPVRKRFDRRNRPKNRTADSSMAVVPGSGAAMVGVRVKIPRSKLPSSLRERTCYRHSGHTPTGKVHCMPIAAYMLI